MSDTQDLSVDLYWSFRSPYSYLATPRLRQISQEYAVNFHVKPVYPLAIRSPEFFEENDPLWLSYMIKDVFRVAQMNNITMGMPRPDPVVQDLTTRKIADEQPYIFRLTRLGALAAERGIGLEFIYQVGTLIWSGEVNWTEGDHLSEVVSRAGENLSAMDGIIQTDKDRLESIIEKNQTDQRAAGHWGVPLMVFKNEPFFGQDRIDALVWRMEQNGLKKREGKS